MRLRNGNNELRSAVGDMNTYREIYLCRSFTSCHAHHRWLTFNNAHTRACLTKISLPHTTATAALYTDRQRLLHHSYLITCAQMDRHDLQTCRLQLRRYHVTASQLIAMLRISSQDYSLLQVALVVKCYKWNGASIAHHSP